MPQRQRAAGLDLSQRETGVQVLDVGQVDEDLARELAEAVEVAAISVGEVWFEAQRVRAFVYDSTGISLRSIAVRQVGSRREPMMVQEASGLLLAEGARFNELISWLAPTTFVPKGLYRFRNHEEANRHGQDCLARGMGALAAQRS